MKSMHKLYLLLSIDAMLLFVLTWFIFQPNTLFSLPKCVLNETTGLFCPSCGATRMAVHLLKLQVWDAIKNNLLIFFTFSYLCFLYILWHVCLFKNKKFPQIYFNNKILFAYVTVVILFSVLRNIPYFPFTLLQP
ncbi:MAG: hypothetical protein BGN88_03905 [Clostridiales bacterium 43-6]|nr:MAG: hypothetical protein BGN88_03905 [Clostridiales bacterium 43-6]